MAHRKLPFRKKPCQGIPDKGVSISISLLPEGKKKKKIHALKHRKFQMLWHFLKEINFQGLSNSMYLNKELTSSAYLKSRWCGK